MISELSALKLGSMTVSFDNLKFVGRSTTGIVFQAYCGWINDFLLINFGTVDLYSIYVQMELAKEGFSPPVFGVFDVSGIQAGSIWTRVKRALQDKKTSPTPYEIGVNLTKRMVGTYKGSEEWDLANWVSGRMGEGSHLCKLVEKGWDDAAFARDPEGYYRRVNDILHAKKDLSGMCPSDSIVNSFRPGMSSLKATVLAKTTTMPVEERRSIFPKFFQQVSSFVRSRPDLRVVRLLEDMSHLVKYVREPRLFDPVAPFFNYHHFSHEEPALFERGIRSVRAALNSHTGFLN